MNQSRYRRPQIRARARLALMRRIARERTRKRGQDLEMPPEREPLIEGRVFINYNENIEPETITSVWVELPLSGIFRKINDMQKHGFWAPRPHRQELLFIPAGRVLQACLRIKENYGE